MRDNCIQLVNGIKAANSQRGRKPSIFDIQVTNSIFHQVEAGYLSRAEFERVELAVTALNTASNNITAALSLLDGFGQLQAGALHNAHRFVDGYIYMLSELVRQNRMMRRAVLEKAAA